MNCKKEDKLLCIDTSRNPNGFKPANISINTIYTADSSNKNTEYVDLVEGGTYHVRRFILLKHAIRYII